MRHRPCRSHSWVPAMAVVSASVSQVSGSTMRRVQVWEAPRPAV